MIFGCVGGAHTSKNHYLLRTTRILLWQERRSAIAVLTHTIQDTLAIISFIIC